MEWLKNVDDGELYPIPDDSEQKSAEKIPGYLAETPQRKSIENDFDKNIAIVNLQKELTETKKELVSVKESQSVDLDKLKEASVVSAQYHQRLQEKEQANKKRDDRQAACVFIGALLVLIIVLIIMMVNKNTYSPENVQPDSTSVSYADTVDVNVQPNPAETQKIQPDESSDSQKSDTVTNEAALEDVELNEFLPILFSMMKIVFPLIAVTAALRIGLNFLSKCIKGD